MAEHLNRTFRKALLFASASGLACVIHVQVLAQVLNDPTRPPAATLPDEGANGVASESAAPVLQSILISPSRRQAIISGKTLTVGERVGDAKIVRITENTVILRNGTDLQTLKLFPGIEKRSNSNPISGNRRQ
ncbi:MAG TPA: MSHA biogenesis protein MshK [Noviherbaspirillum sp.]|nr:MSHA biogenesis protein MshK [Noviherbaspirillum sp.]